MYPVDSYGIAVSITDADGKRSWLEANSVDGGPTEWSASHIKRVAETVVGGKSAIDVNQRPLLPTTPIKISPVAKATDMYALPDGRVAPIYPDMTIASGWGSSSLMASNAPFHLEKLFQSYGCRYSSQGQGGETSIHVAARLGSNPFRIRVENGLIPSTGSVNLVIEQLPVTTGNQAMRPFTGFLSGVFGTVSYSPGSGGYLRFTRQDAGEAVNVGSNTVTFIPGASDTLARGIGLLWMHKNDTATGWSVYSDKVNDKVTFDNISKAFEFFTSFQKRVIVLGVFNDTDAMQSNKDAVARLNKLCEIKYGALYLDVQSYIISPKIWVDTGITPTSVDLDQQAQGVKPVSLSIDPAHLNEKAIAAVIGVLLKEKIDSLEWFA